MKADEFAVFMAEKKRYLWILALNHDKSRLIGSVESDGDMPKIVQHSEWS